jgi:hypothetical protein
MSIGEWLAISYALAGLSTAWLTWRFSTGESEQLWIYGLYALFWPVMAIMCAFQGLFVEVPSREAVLRRRREAAERRARPSEVAPSKRNRVG